MSLSQLSLSLSWQAVGSLQYGIDLDIAAFMLAEDKKIPDERFLVYYHNPQSADGAIQLSFDDRQGGEGEMMEIDLTKVDKKIEEIILIASVYEGSQNKLTFGKSVNAHLCLKDKENGNVIKETNLSLAFSGESSIEFGRLFYRFNRWRFESLGIGYSADFDRFVDKYVV